MARAFLQSSIGKVEPTLDALKTQIDPIHSGG